MKHCFNMLGTILIFFSTACASKRSVESNSGPDQIVAGATALIAGTPAKDSVDPSDGDQTDWYAVSGEDGQAEVTFLNDDPTKVEARIYRLIGKKQTPVLFRSLKPVQPIRLNLKRQEWYVQIQAKKGSKESKYSLVRKDHGNKKGSIGKEVAVLDIYPLSDSKGLVLLKATDDTKVGSTLIISGQNNDGPVADLGDCEITSLASGHASCTLPSFPKSKFARYKANTQ